MKLRRSATLLLLLLVIAAGAGSWALWRAQQAAMDQPLSLARAEIYTLTPGTSLRALAGDLDARGWLQHAWQLVLQGRLDGVAQSLRAGEYRLDPGTTPRQLLQMVVAGRVVQYQLTLLEGWTFAQIMDAVRSSPVLQQTLEHADVERVLEAIDCAGRHPEGLLFPDTYRFPRGTTDVEFLRRACRTMQRVLLEEWQRRDVGLPYADPYQALIMASLVEKESAVAAERPRIAGVFVRRLQRGMRLQTDPTVIYALGADYDGNIRRADLALDSPYNTYVHGGLPPTPIAAPGRDSIRAALQPEPGEELYFVARGDGSHEFSRTLAEHNRAVRKYQLQGGR